MKNNLAILFIALCNSLFATNRYVSSVSGSASGTGTQGNPYKALSQLPALAAGDTVFLQCGSLFRESLSLFAGGSSGAQLVITSYGSGAKPIISGVDTVKNWTQSGNKFYATQTGSVKNFFANNKEQIIARTPNEGSYYELDSAQTSYLKDAGISQPNGFWNGAKICVHAAQWCWEKTTVGNFQNGKVDYAPALTIAALQRYGYFFYDKDSCLDVAREWYYDSINSRIWFIPPSGTPNNIFCEATVRTSGILLQNNAHYVTISNIRFEKQFNAGVQLSNQTLHTTIYNCEFFGQYNHGVQTRGKYHLISNCSFSEVDGHGVDINAGGNTELRYCTFKNIGQFRNSGIGGQTNLSAVAVNFTDSCYLHHNIIDSTGYCGISCDGAYSVVERNIASHCMLLNNDGAPFKAFGNTSHHTVFRNNIAHDSPGNTEGCFNPSFETPGLYFDLLVNNNTLENNTIYNIPQKGIFLNCGTSDNHANGNVIFGSEVALDLNGSLQVNDTLNRVEVKRNVFCELNSSSYALRQVDSYTPAVFTQGVLDSNYYFQPYATSHVVFRPGNTPQNLSLSQWQSFSGQDAHTRNAFGNYNTSTYTPSLFVNATDNDSTFNLGTTQYLDLDSNIVCGSITVPAFYSKVLIATTSTCASVNLNAYIMQLHTAGCDNASGKLVAMGTGGTGAYMFLWSNGATTDTVDHLAAGTYTVTVSSGGSSATGTVTLDSFGVGDVHVQHACNGNNNGWIFLDNPVAQYPLQYVWYRNDTLLTSASAQINSLGAGTYRWYMTDNDGCVDSGMVTIQSSTPVMDVFVSDTALCWGESAQVWYTPGFTVNYWGTDFNTATDTLTFTNQMGATSLPQYGIDSLGCQSNYVDPLPFVYLASHPDPVQLYQFSDTISASWGISLQPDFTNTYIWRLNGSTIDSSHYSFLVIDTSGFYSVSIINQYGCTVAGTINVTYTAVKEMSGGASGFSLFPNPAKENLYIICNDGFVGEEIFVLDVSGRKIFTQTIADNISEINLNALAGGIYFVRIKNEVRKFLKE